MSKHSIKKKMKITKMKIYTKKTMKMKRRTSRGKIMKTSNKIKKRKIKAKVNYKSI